MIRVVIRKSILTYVSICPDKISQDKRERSWRVLEFVVFALVMTVKGTECIRAVTRQDREWLETKLKFCASDHKTLTSLESFFVLTCDSPCALGAWPSNDHEQRRSITSCSLRCGFCIQDAYYVHDHRVPLAQGWNMWTYAKHTYLMKGQGNMRCYPMRKKVIKSIHLQNNYSITRPIALLSANQHT